MAGLGRHALFRRFGRSRPKISVAGRFILEAPDEVLRSIALAILPAPRQIVRRRLALSATTND